jgi:hypothetical protein
MAAAIIRALPLATLVADAVPSLAGGIVGDRPTIALNALTRMAGLAGFTVRTVLIAAVCAACGAGVHQRQDGSGRQQRHMLLTEFDEIQRIGH